MNTSIIVEDFEAAALPHMDDLFRTARRVLGNQTEAEDVVQETFLQAWKSFERFEPGTNCRAWLYKIMFHVIQHSRRKRFSFNLRSTRDDGVELEASLVYEPPVPQELTDEEVIAAFDRIPTQYREVMVLADVQDFSYREVAETLNIPQGTVMSRLNRGRKLLRVELAQYSQAYGIQATSGEAMHAQA
ncbi:MAG TPA: sigma-70 family RNA polymerase sigma factor [Blastocatellia bacterium]|nr:sigma-70 family RNA polymerase sigma factor [Blastocatellia bacterium]